MRIEEISGWRRKYELHTVLSQRVTELESQCDCRAVLKAHLRLSVRNVRRNQSTRLLLFSDHTFSPPDQSAE